MKIVIIEDERFTARDLRNTIEEIEPNAEIIKMLSSVEESILYFQKGAETIDLIFSDIQLGDGLSFEIFEQVRLTTPIIFCTAFNQYALDAFKTFSIHYMLKPFSSTSVAEALDKYKAMKTVLKPEENNYAEIISLIKNQGKPQHYPSVIIQKGDKIIPLSGDKVAVFFIQNDAVYAFTFKGEKHFLSNKLNALEEKFGARFFRANRQYLVNRKAVKDASHHFNRKIQINLSVPFQENILVGKLKTTAFLKWLADS